MVAANPFSSMLVRFDPSHVYGRQSLLGPIMDGVCADSPRSFGLQGIKTLGTTTLLRFLCHPEGARGRYPDLVAAFEQGGPSQRRLVFLYVDLYAVEGHALLRRLLDVVAEADLPVRESDSWRFQAMATPPPQPESSSRAESANLAREDEGDVRTALTAAFQAAREAGLRLVVCLDHFDRAFGSMTLKDDTFLRSLAQLQSLIVVTERALPDLRRDARFLSPLLTVLDLRQVGLLDEVGARQLLHQPIGKAPAFSSTEEELLLKTAGRQPYLLTLAAESLFALGPPDAGAVEASVKDPAGAARFCEMLLGLPAVDALFTYFHGLLDVRAWSVVQDLAAGRPVDSASAAVLSRLTTWGLVQSDWQTGHHALFGDLFAAFVRARSGEDVPDADEPSDLVDSLSPLDSRLLRHFLEHPNQLCDFRTLLEVGWETPPTSNAPLEAAIFRLRARLAQFSRSKGGTIRNERGRGYVYSPRA